MARLSEVFLSFTLLQLAWGLDISHSKYGSLSPGIVPSPVASGNFYRSSPFQDDVSYSDVPDFDPLNEWPSFVQIMLQELLGSALGIPDDYSEPNHPISSEPKFEDKAEENEEEVKLVLRESDELVDDMHEMDRFFSL